MNSVNHTAGDIKTLIVLLTALLAASANLRGGELVLPDSPLFLRTAVPPNVFLQIDDSGSMLEEVLTRPYWLAYCYDPNSPGWASGNWDCQAGSWERATNGSWFSFSGDNQFFTNFGYLFPTRDTLDNAWHEECRDISPNRDRSDDWIPRVVLSCGGSFNPVTNPPYKHDWRILSSDLNVLYYNPNQTYLPWKGPCNTAGAPCANASFDMARSNPFEGSDGYGDTRNLNGFVYEVWEDDKGYSGDVPRRGSDTDGSTDPKDGAVNVTSGANGEIDLWDSHTRYTVETNRIKVELVRYSPDETGLNPTVTALPPITDSTEVTAVKQNIANWYQYHRRRSLTAKAAIAEVISKRPNLRYGASVINHSRTNPFFVEVPDPAVTNFTSHNANLLNKLLGFQMGNGGTPLRQGLEAVGRYFDNTDGRADPILPAEKGGSCQKNFALLFTDGYWNRDAPSVGDADGDGIAGTLADVAMHYYQKDLSPLDNNVPADANDPATHQHMVTFGAAFGVDGLLSDTDGDGWPNPPLASNGNWGDPTAENAGAAKIDDLWHAAFNSKGGFFSAATPESLLDGLNRTMEQITGRSNAAAASIALSTGYISGNSRVYQARFNNGDWSGQLLSYRLHTDPSNSNFGALDTSGSGPDGSDWDAAQLIPPHNVRTILTWSGGAGRYFRWSNLTSAQQTALRSQQVVDYLRGDQGQEQKNGGALRNRDNKLGDIINSSPLFVGPPAFRYGFDGYASFRSNHGSRPGMIYVGANDGMLHGFDATTGVEKFAYVPGKIIHDRLASLARPDYTHKFFVDATPVMGDAYFGGSWRTLLAGGLNRGGQGIYLLDITEPESFGPSNVLWEFTDQDDPDLGYTYSQPAIARMQNGQWAVIFGNGYNNTESDGNPSTSGRAVLYIAFVDRGSSGWVERDNFFKLDTGQGWTTKPNGLSSATPVDIDGDNKVDYIYAGDLHGNLWKFDVTDPNPSNWIVATLGGTGPTPLFQTQIIKGDGSLQPITVRPEVGRTPFGNGIMVYFGTGKFIEERDVSSTEKQSFYGILDKDEPVTPARLQQQTIVEESHYSPGDLQVRLTSNNKMLPSDQGWYLDLPAATGERQISNPVLRGRQIVFTTMSPSGSTCESGGKSWLMVLDAFHGSRLQISPFDLDKDGDFDDSDRIDGNAASGMQIGQIANTPGFATTNDMDFLYLTGDPVSEPYKLRPAEATGRKSWRQVH